MKKQPQSVSYASLPANRLRYRLVMTDEARFGDRTVMVEKTSEREKKRFAPEEKFYLTKRGAA